MATTQFEAAGSAAAKLAAQPNASAGLKGLVAAVQSYLTLSVDLLGSGHPAQVPDFSDLISATDNGKNYGSLTDTTDESELTTAYNQSVGHVEQINQRLVGQDQHVGGQVRDLADLTDSTCGQIDAAVTSLQNALDNPRLPAPPQHDFAAEGAMIGACLTAVDNVYTDLQAANDKINQRAKQIAATNPPVVRTAAWSTPVAAAPASYGTPLSSSAVQSLVAGVPDPQMRAFIGAALSEVGKPYVWGAEGPNAFDCSGLVQYSAEQAGISGVPRTAAEQYHATMSNSVAPNDLQPGDLIFPDAEFNGGNPGHVMIYVGNGEVVEAPHSNEDVKTISLAQVGGFHATRF